MTFLGRFEKISKIDNGTEIARSTAVEKKKKRGIFLLYMNLIVAGFNMNYKNLNF